jgi:hypothetical protein
MDPKAKKDTFKVMLRRGTPATNVREISALQHPRRDVTYADGWLSIPDVEMEAMQTRVFATPRPELARSAVEWAKVQTRRWHTLTKISPRQVELATVEQPDNLLPLVDDWQCAIGISPTTAWTGLNTPTSGDWKPVRLGTFATMGLPDNARAQFRRDVTLPDKWRDQRLTLHFNAEHWFWGINPGGRLWINGELVKDATTLKPNRSGNFSIDLSPGQTASGRLVIALEIDARKPGWHPGARPRGVSGTFFLTARPRPVQTKALDHWSAATDLNVLTTLTTGQPSTNALYFETRFSLPAQWPARRLFLETPDVSLGTITLNNYQIKATQMGYLDIGGLVRRDGENVLRWQPASRGDSAFPKLNLSWTAEF